VVGSEVSDLLGLLVHNIGGIVDVVVNELLVGLVDKRSEEEDTCGEKSHTPEWDDLD